MTTAHYPTMKIINVADKILRELVSDYPNYVSLEDLKTRLNLTTRDLVAPIEYLFGRDLIEVYPRNQGNFVANVRYKITSEGIDFIKEIDQSQQSDSNSQLIQLTIANTIIGNVIQANQTNIQSNIEIGFNEIIEAIDREPNTTQEQKQLMKERFRRLKEVLNENKSAGIQISGQLLV